MLINLRFKILYYLRSQRYWNEALRTRTSWNVEYIKLNYFFPKHISPGIKYGKNRKLEEISISDFVCPTESHGRIFGFVKKQSSVFPSPLDFSFLQVNVTRSICRWNSRELQELLMYRCLWESVVFNVSVFVEIPNCWLFVSLVAEELFKFFESF